MRDNISDFDQMLKENNIDLCLLNKYLESKEFELIAGPVVDDNNPNYIKNKSNISGLGIFATKDLCKNDIIGYGIINNTRTFAGRYTNHALDNNAKFYYSKNNNNVILIAVKKINKNQEIVVNYRHHTYNKEYY